MTTLDVLIERFATAIEDSFGFLVTDLGFAYCGSKVIDIDDPRETAILARYARDNTTVEIWMSALSLTISVFIKRFRERADCSIDSIPISLIDLEVALPATNSARPPLPWMREHTLREEALAGFRRFSKLMSQHLEDAVAYLGQHLRDSSGRLGL